MLTKNFMNHFKIEFGNWVTPCGKFYCYHETGNVYRLGEQGYQEPVGKWDDASSSIIWSQPCTTSPRQHSTS